MLAWGINSCIMPLFFIMSGYLAAQLASDREPRSFLKHRLSRLGLPLLVGFVLVLPADLYVWVLGWVTQGLIPWSSLRRLSFPDELDAALWGPAHLWYLEFLLIYSLVAGMVLSSRFPAAIQRHFQIEKLSKVWRDPAGLLSLTLASLCCGLILWRQPRVLIGFNNGILPPWENLLFFAVPFSLGWMRKQQELHQPVTVTRRSRTAWQLAVSAVLGLMLVPQLQWHLAHETQPAAAALPPFLFAAFGLTFASGLFGLALLWKGPKAPAAIAYLAAASFWIYLAHHPLTGLVNIAFQSWNRPAWIEFAMANLIVVAMCLASYEVGVRRTWLGRVLNGTRQTIRPATESLPKEQPQSVSRAA